MKTKFRQRQVSVAIAALFGSAALLAAPQILAAGKVAGKYVAGDFHNHTTCSDGSISIQKLVNKSMDSAWGLDWFVQAGHGGNGNRNCSLVEDESLATAEYPYVSGKTPNTTWADSIGKDKLKGLSGGASGTGNMWRWQSLQEVQYQVMEYLSELKNQPLILGLESVVAGHEHTSMSIITGQMPYGSQTAVPLNVPGYTPLGTYVAAGNATALAQWSYCFDRGDTDTSRGNITGTATGNNWNCSVTGSANASNASWNTTAQKLMPASGTGTGDRGHYKTVEAVKWMTENHPNGSYYVPAHLERAGPFNPDGNNGFNIEHLRNLNNAAPTVAFGMETQPGHGASANRGEYQPKRNNFGTGNFDIGGGTKVNVDSAGGTTYGGTGVYGSVVGGVWDALLGEGRNFWFFASSDWHNRGAFGPDDRRSTQDFLPGEYQRNYTMVRNNGDKLRPQTIVDGLRTGNNFAASGQLIDRMAFIACASYPGIGKRTDAAVEALALTAATNNTDIDVSGCATMGEKLVVRPGAEIVVSIVVRDPSGANFSPYTFPNPSLKQIDVDQPLNMPVLHHVDLIRGMVSGYKTPGTAGYSGEWPRNTNWLATDGTTASLAVVPAAAKNTTAGVIKTFSGEGATPSWTPVSVAGGTMLKMTYRIPAVSASQYVRIRGTNLPASVPYETDASGNPLSDLYTNAGDTTKLRIPCTTTGTVLTGDAIDGCPAHMAVVSGQKMVSYDVAAWADLWFYSNPIYIQVNGSTTVAGVK
jgi:hypothetical protein